MASDIKKKPPHGIGSKKTTIRLSEADEKILRALGDHLGLNFSGVTRLGWRTLAAKEGLRA